MDICANLVEKYHFQLDNGIRETLLQLGLGKALMVVEGLYELKIDPDNWLTFNQALDMLSSNFGMSYQLIYQGLRCDSIFQRRKSEGVAHRRGPRPYLYRLPYPEELRAEFAPDLQPTPRDTLHRDDLRNLTAYRMGLHRELYIRKWLEKYDGFTMYRELQAERLGVSVRTVRTYDKKLGHSNEANYKERRITKENWNSLPRYKEQYDANGKRRSSRKWLKVVDWESGESYNQPLVRYLAYKGMQGEKHAVYEVERLANTYYPYQRPQKSSALNYDPVADYLAERRALNAAHFYQDVDGSWYHQRE